MMCEHDYRELLTIGCFKCKKTMVELKIEKQLAAANARVKRMEDALLLAEHYFQEDSMVQPDHVKQMVEAALEEKQ